MKWLCKYLLLLALFSRKTGGKIKNYLDQKYETVLEKVKNV